MYLSLTTDMSFTPLTRLVSTNVGHTMVTLMFFFICLISADSVSEKPTAANLEPLKIQAGRKNSTTFLAMGNVRPPIKVY